MFLLQEEPVAMDNPDVPKFPGCKVQLDHIQRVTIVGPYEKSNEVFDILFDSGFRIVRSGPYTDKAMHPKVDMKRFLFIADRIVDQEG